MSSHNPSRAKKDNTALRIVTQYRDKSSMVYELRCGDAELNLRISAHQTDDDEEQNGDERGFAGAVGADDTDNFALIDGHGKIIQRQGIFEENH